MEEEDEAGRDRQAGTQTGGLRGSGGQRVVGSSGGMQRGAERSGSDGAKGASARGSEAADGRKGAGVNGAPVIPAPCPHRPPHSSRVEQVLSPPHSNRGGNNRCSQLLPHSLQPPEAQKTHCQGPPSHLNTASGLERRHHQGPCDLISGRKMINKETDLSDVENKRQSRLQVNAI